MYHNMNVSRRDFRFAFMKGRSSEHFPEHTAKVVQAGGYMPVQIQCEHDDEEDDVKVIALLVHNETDLGFYHRLNLSAPEYI